MPPQRFSDAVERAAERLMSFMLSMMPRVTLQADSMWLPGPSSRIAACLISRCAPYRRIPCLWPVDRYQAVMLRRAVAGHAARVRLLIRHVKHCFRRVSAA